MLPIMGQHMARFAALGRPEVNGSAAMVRVRGLRADGRILSINPTDRSAMPRAAPTIGDEACHALRPQASKASAVPHCCPTSATGPEA